MAEERSPRELDVETSVKLDDQVRQDMRRRSRRGFLVGGAATLAGVAGWRMLQDQRVVRGLPGSYRKVLDFNSGIARRFFRVGALAPEFDPSRAVPEFRLNGDIGLSDIAGEDWRLQLIGAAHPERYPQYTLDVTSWDYGYESDDPESQPAASATPAHEQDAKGEAVRMKTMTAPGGLIKQPGLLMTMEHVRGLPRRDMTTEFKCVEGWSEIARWGGVRLSDFIAAYPPPTRHGKPLALGEAPYAIPEYVGFETPDAQYYVGIEREAALHPQTLLAYELNGVPLSMAHGAPLRLVTPLKYGIKNLKQIGRMFYTDRRPRDFWYEQGYDYYAGL